MANCYTALPPLIYLAFVPAVVVMAMFAGVELLSRPATRRLALLVSAAVLFVGGVAGVRTGTIGPAVSGAAPFAFLLWYGLVTPLFTRVIGRFPVVTGPGTQNWVWWDVVYTWVLFLGGGAIGACSMAAFDWWGPSLSGPTPSAV